MKCTETEQSSSKPSHHSQELCSQVRSCSLGPVCSLVWSLVFGGVLRCLIFPSGGRSFTQQCFNINFPLQPRRDWAGLGSDLVLVEIARNNHSLGMVIEGGSDTSQEEARIINILPGGAAFETAGLRVGQIIKEVEGLALKGEQ